MLGSCAQLQDRGCDADGSTESASSVRASADDDGFRNPRV